MDTVAQFLVYGQQLYSRLCGKDLQYTLTEKVQAITALQSSLRAITECCCKTASLVAKNNVDKEIQCLPWSPYLTFLNMKLSSGSADEFGMKCLRQEEFRKGFQLK